MILKYGGKCSRCGVAIPKGAEADYDGSTKTIAHYQCQAGELEPDTADRHALADALGFIRYDDFNADILARWFLWNLSPQDSGEAAGRTGTDSRGRDATLF